MNTLLSTLQTALASYQQSRFLLIGFSGGLDSTVLLHLLVTWREQDPQIPPLRAIHVNHGISVHADAWQAHCEEMCVAWSVKCAVKRVRVDSTRNLESVARQARYKAFEDDMAKDCVLVTAHHLDDQVETFFLRMLRSAGLRGLASMATVRPLGQGVLVRPLLNIPRQVLEEYAQAHQLKWIEDESNQQLHWTRNRLRAGVMRQFKADFPMSLKVLGQSIEHLRNAQMQLERFYQSLYWQGQTLPCVLSIEELRARAPWLDLGLCLRQWLTDLSWPLVEQARIMEFTRQAQTAAADRQPKLVLDERYALYASQGCIYAVDWDELDLLTRALQALPLPLGWRWATVSQVKSLKIAQEAFHRHGFEWLKSQGVLPWWREGFPVLLAGEEVKALGAHRVFFEPHTRAEMDFVKAWHQLGANWWSSVDFFAPK